jgi:heme exporter protein B
VLAGFMWITILFAGLIGFARTFEIERSEGALDALLMAPVDRSGLFLSKAAANLVSIAIVELILLPAFAVFFDIDLGGGWAALIGVVVLADVGFVSVGTLFASVAAQTRSRELVLPILALPALVPVFIGATELTSDLFAGGGPGEIIEAGWFAVLAVFSLIFAILGAIGSDFVLD